MGFIFYFIFKLRLFLFAMFRCTYQNTSFTVAPVDGKADASDLEDERLVSPFEAMIILLKIGISRNMILLWIWLGQRGWCGAAPF